MSPGTSPHEPRAARSTRAASASTGPRLRARPRSLPLSAAVAPGQNCQRHQHTVRELGPAPARRRRRAPAGGSRDGQGANTSAFAAGARRGHPPSIRGPRADGVGGGEARQARRPVEAGPAAVPPPRGRGRRDRRARAAGLAVRRVGVWGAGLAAGSGRGGCDGLFGHHRPGRPPGGGGGARRDSAPRFCGRAGGTAPDVKVGVVDGCGGCGVACSSTVAADGGGGTCVDGTRVGRPAGGVIGVSTCRRRAAAASAVVTAVAVVTAATVAAVVTLVVALAVGTAAVGVVSLAAAAASASAHTLQAPRAKAAGGGGP